MTISVLIVDDHAVIRDGLRAILESGGDITVVGEADDGLAAAKQAARLRPNVVLMDINMPNCNGVEATPLLHAASPSSQVIMLSLYSTTDQIVRALRAGARGYVLKEAAGPDVIAAVRAVHAGRRYLSPKIADAALDSYLRDGSIWTPLDALSRREREIAQLVAEGRTSIEIGRMLCLSPKTVETYRSRLMHKIGVGDISGIVKFAIRHGLTALQ